MRKLIALLLILCFHHISYGQNDKKAVTHYVCFQPTGEFHDKEFCARLQMCSGGRSRKVSDVHNLRPCPKCARKVKIVKDHAGFSDIKRVLGVKDRKQIADSLGTDEGIILRPGFTLRITGLPGTKTVNNIDFVFARALPFDEDSLFSENLFQQLGLKFTGCKADTLRSSDQKKISIEYRGCAIVEPRDKYDDVSTYFYELIFLAKETEAPTLEKIQLLLRFEGDQQPARH